MPILILFLFFLFSPGPCLAQSEFQVHQKISYQINSKGSASVTQETDLINNYSQIYAKEYKTIISGNDVSNLTAVDNTGNILDKITRNDDNTEVALKFNQPVLGKDQTTHFILTYAINHFAVNKGSTWEISLPEFKNLQSQDSLNIKLTIPSQFGTLSYSSISNPPVIYGSDTQITLTKDHLNNKKVLLVFGNNQLFDFSLKYILNNDSDDYISTQIALPPDTNYQKVTYSDINPLPVDVTADSDGNWLAEYHLDPRETKEVVVSGQAKIHSRLSTTQPPPDERLLAPSKFWPTTDPSIESIATTLTTPKQIYDYVVKTLSYSYSSINSARRKGALDALVSPDESLCTEFTDLFVTLARAKGIPAREIEGFAYTNNPKIKPVNQNADVLHAWPQYYNTAKKVWISVDPTWEKTTNGIDFFSDLDLNHFAFVIHGVQADYPAPAGSYKNKQQVKTVNVQFATQEIKPTNKLPTIEVLKTSFNKPVQIKITNNNLLAINGIDAVLTQNGWTHHIESLPPLGSSTVTIPPLSFFTSLLPQSQKLNFAITYNNSSNSVYQSVVYYPHFLNLAIVATLLIALLSVSGIILTGKFKSNP